MARRNSGLDVLRALAVLLVIGRHAPPTASDDPAWVQSLMAPWIAGGWAGVDLFFVISGFLVAGLLFRELRDRGCVSPGHFLIRRGFKIYPAFYFMLVCTFLANADHGMDQPSARIISEVLFLQSYISSVWNHTWSLAVEEHFYLLLALLFALLTVGRTRAYLRVSTVLGLYALIASACLVLRLRISVSQPYGHMTHLFPTHLRVDSLFLGVLLSYLQCFHEPALRRLVERFRLPLAVVSTALLSIPFLLPLERNAFLTTVGLTLIAWGSGGLVLLAYYADLSGSRFVRGLARVGRDSYSIYLWHMPVLVWMVPLILAAMRTEVSYPVAIVVYVVASVLFGAWLARTIEHPMVRLRDRLFPPGDSPVPLAASERVAAESPA